MIIRRALWGFGGDLGVYTIKGIARGGCFLKNVFVKRAVCAVRIEKHSPNHFNIIFLCTGKGHFLHLHCAFEHDIYVTVVIFQPFFAIC